MPLLDYENRDSLHQRQNRTQREDLARRVLAALFGGALFIGGLAVAMSKSVSSEGREVTGGRAIVAGIGLMCMASFPAYIAFHGGLRQSRWIWLALAMFLFGIALCAFAEKFWS